MDGSRSTGSLGACLIVDALLESLTRSLGGRVHLGRMVHLRRMNIRKILEHLDGTF